MEMTQENKKIKLKITAAKNKSLRPTPRKLGRFGIPPPALKLIVVLGMTSSVRANFVGKQPVLFLLRNAREFSFAEERGGETSNKAEWRRKGA
jgi:hypothetical protein